MPENPAPSEAGFTHAGDEAPPVVNEKNSLEKSKQNTTQQWT
jgi:hypothetical protein